jgi:NAD(P)-dependent dehydrogenase (short-subunit alcohol dehydrogenase family)
MPVNLDDVDPDVVAKYALDKLPFDRPQSATADLLDLRGKRAIVTGGGGDGLGNATCHRLAEQGASIAVLDVFQDVADATAQQLTERWGVDVLALATDVGDPGQVSAAVDRIAAAWGGVDLLVNNAGGSGSIKPSGDRVTQHGTFVDMDMDDLLGVVRVNLLGVMLMTKAVLTPMIDAGRGRIINVASEGGKISVDNLAVYSACKSGVIGFTRNIARDYGKFGIAVTCVCPGIMVSERTVTTLSQPGARGLASLESTFPRVTIGRCSIADEVASVISFLASDAGAYVHGTAVSVGGGMAD